MQLKKTFCNFGVSWGQVLQVKVGYILTIKVRIGVHHAILANANRKSAFF